MVTTCHGMNLPLFCSAIFAAASNPPQAITRRRHENRPALRTNNRKRRRPCDFKAFGVLFTPPCQGWRGLERVEAYAAQPMDQRGNLSGGESRVMGVRLPDQKIQQIVGQPPDSLPFIGHGGPVGYGGRDLLGQSQEEVRKKIGRAHV